MLEYFDFNKIYIIESIPESDIKTGTNLYNDVVKWEIEKHEILKSELSLIYTKKEFLDKLEIIKTEAHFQGILPFIHLEIHGSKDKDGLVLCSGELITWLEIAEQFREINQHSQNNLVVSLATCYGAYIFPSIKVHLRAPFWGFIGPWGKVYPDDVEISFSAFFKTLLTSLDVNDAVISLNNENSLAYRYHFYNSEEVFEKIWEMYEEIDYSPENFESRLETLTTEAESIDPSIPRKMIKEFLKTELLKKNEIKEKYRRDFLMS